MQSLEPVFDRFGKRLDAVDDIFSEWIGEWSGCLTSSDRMFLEGLLSSLWQHWCLFCRRIVMASALGCETRSGVIIQPCVTPTSWKRVSYIGRAVRANSSVVDGKINSMMHLEPTWGDINRLLKIIEALKPDNENTLSGSFGAATQGPFHAQAVRNASAHRNHQTWAATKKLMPYYIANRIAHPIDVLLWEEPRSRDFAIMAWIDEMRVIAELAID